MNVIRDSENAKFYFNLAQGGAVIAGGYPRWISMYDAPAPSDVDIFCPTLDSFLFTEKAIIDSGKFYKVTSTDSSDSYAPKDPFDSGLTKDINIIHGVKFNSTNELLDGFDFSVCQFWLTGPTDVAAYTS